MLHHAYVVMHEPPAVNFAAVGLQDVLTQSKRQVIVQQPNVPQQICRVKRHDYCPAQIEEGSTHQLTKVQFDRAVHESDWPQDEHNCGPGVRGHMNTLQFLVNVHCTNNLSRNFRYSDLSSCLAVEENSTTLT